MTVNSVYRVTHKQLVEFAHELGYRVYGQVGSSMVGIPYETGGYRSVHGPCTTKENMAFLRGVRDGRAEVRDEWHRTLLANGK